MCINLLIPRGSVSGACLWRDMHAACKWYVHYMHVTCTLHACDVTCLVICALHIHVTCTLHSNVQEVIILLLWCNGFESIIIQWVHLCKIVKLCGSLIQKYYWTDYPSHHNHLYGWPPFLAISRPIESGPHKQVRRRVPENNHPIHLWQLL